MDGTIPDWSDITDYDYEEDLHFEFANNTDENVSLNGNGNGNGGIASGMPDCYAGYVNYLPVGNYVLVFTLYGDEYHTLKLGEWREYAGLAATANAAITGIGTEDNYFLLWFCRLFGKPQRYFFYGLPVYTD